jgi:hypothetical protein
MKAKIYRLSPPAVSEAAIRALAKRLGFEGSRVGKLCTDAETLTYSEGPLELKMYRASGGVRFRDRSRWQVDDRGAKFNLTEESARRLAQSFTKKNRLAATSEMRFLKSARLRVGEADRESKQSFERTIDISIALQRMVDKIPVDGPGGKIVVFFDRDGVATGFEQLWRTIRGASRRPGALRPPQAALDEMVSRWRQRQGVVEVSQIRFGYFEEGWRKRQTYLQPAYVILGEIYADNPRVRRKIAYVATALEKPAGRLTPPLGEKPAQPPRRGAPGKSSQA